MPRIAEAITETQIGLIRELFIEYWQWLQFDPCFQDFEEELTTLPGAYAKPAGCMLLALRAGEAAGCVALRPIADSICEMKRLYVREAYRGAGLGRQLTTRIIDEAKQIGYTRMRLDTLPIMTSAVALYTSLGFVEIDPYTKHRAPGAQYLELTLSPTKENS